MPIPNRRHYGDYPQIEDGVGMIRSFLNTFENLLKRAEKSGKAGKREPAGVAVAANVRTHALAVKPADRRPQVASRKSLRGTILTGEMFAPTLAPQIEKLNAALGSRFKVLAVPNTYFGGDVAVAGLLSGQDYLAVRDRIEGDFAIIPKHTIKSDEPVLIDGMQFDDLKRQFPVPVYDFDLEDFVEFVLN